MVSKPHRKAAKRDTLTPRKIVDEALAMADIDGIESVTIRRLARELGVTPMALYWHFHDKDELLDAMAASIFEDLELSVDASVKWQDQLRKLLGSILHLLRAHPAAATLLSTRTVSTESSLRATEVMLEILALGGFSPAESTQIARHALSTVSNLVTGEPGVVSQDEAGQSIEARQRARHFLESLSPERYPRLVEAAKPLSEGINPETYFTFGLNLLVAGIETMAARKHGGNTPLV